MTQNSMITEIEELSNYIDEHFWLLDDEVRRILDFNEIMSIKEMVIVGCGDSYMAGVATANAIKKFAHISVSAKQSMNAARYDFIDPISSFPRNPLTVGVSVSGTVSRTCEAVAVSKENGSLTVAVTANDETPLGKIAEKVLKVPSPGSPTSPGVTSYRTSCLVLYLLGIRFGEVSGRLSQSEGNLLRKELLGTGKIIEKTIEKNKKKLQQFADSVAGEDHFVFLGSGPNEASALFSAAKVVEANGRNAVGQDLEEWAHLQYFENVSAATPTFLIAPYGNAYSRAVELIEPMKRVGRTIVAIVPEDEKTISEQADWVFPVIGDVKEIFSPMVYTVAAELFAAYFTDVVKGTYFRASESAYTSGDNGIRSSKVHSRSELMK